MKQSLFEITTNLRTLQEQLEDELIASGGDVTEGTRGADIQAAIDGYEWKQAEKVDAYVSIIRNIQAHEAQVAGAIELLEKRRQVLVNQVERLKAAAKNALQANGLTVAKGIIHGGLRIQQNSAAPIEILEADANKWPDDLTVTRREIDRKKLAEVLKSDEADKVAGFARIGERGTHIRVI